MNSIHIENLRLTPGARAGLGEPTATCQWSGLSHLDELPFLNLRLRTAVKEFSPAEPLYGLNADDWPQALVSDSVESEGVAAWGVALTVAMMRLARDPVGMGRVIHKTGEHISVALPWQREAVLKTAMSFALRHLVVWLLPSSTGKELAASLKREFAQWLDSVQPGGLAPNTLRFALAAGRRDIPVAVRRDHLQLGWGKNAELMDSSFTGRTGNIATRIARNKYQTSQILRRGLVPVPPAALVHDWSLAQKVAEKLGWPVVVKPSNQDQGVGVVPGIGDWTTLKRAFDAAEKFSPGAVIVEKHIAGNDHRVLVVGGGVLMATRRIPGGVTGDGVLSVRKLVAKVNADPRRGMNKRSLLIALALDEEAAECLERQGLDADSVPDAGCFVYLRRTANISTGGTAVDVTAQVHPDNCGVVERAARLVGLDIAGVDFICPDVSRSWREVGGAICEVNAQPGFRPHWLGDPERDVNGEVVDWLFCNKTARIPAVAITGTNGKSTTALMLHHIFLTAGVNSGVCSTNGLWVGHELVSDQNLSGYPGGRILLEDPAVEAVVIEMPRKGLIRFGHPCDRYDVAALLNVQDDHIGVDGINSLEDMARCKAEVLARASKAVVVNADDPLCLEMLGYAPAKRHILVGRDAGLSQLQSHLARGGDAVFTQFIEGAGWIVLAQGSMHWPLMPLAEIPATMNGILKVNELNSLFAAALAWAQGIAPEVIRLGLGGFDNSREKNPGRYNFIDGFPFRILLDFGHNPDGVRELCRAVSSMQVTGRRRLLSLKLGNRHLGHVDLVASCLADTFDTFVVGCDAHYVRECADYESEDPEETMLAAMRNALVKHGAAERCIVTERDQFSALTQAVASAQPGDLLVLLAEPWWVLQALKKILSEKVPTS